MRTASRTLPVFLLGSIIALLPVTGCNGNPGEAPPPVFTWDIPLPLDEDQSAAALVLPAGGQAVVPVTLVAYSDPIEVDLSMDYDEGFPDGIQVVFSTPYENISLPAGQQHISKITFTASPDVPPGTYRTHLIGMLARDVNGIRGIARQIAIHVTAN
jgi:hypothetical protein